MINNESDLFGQLVYVRPVQNKKQRWQAPARRWASLERTETKRNKADKS
ncbi:hypothetical protein [Deinococcus alpinitundrae]|nr:hypothetical protein [Deinococcus alpinitundrae]